MTARRHRQEDALKGAREEEEEGTRPLLTDMKTERLTGGLLCFVAMPTVPTRSRVWLSALHPTQPINTEPKETSSSTPQREIQLELLHSALCWTIHIIKPNKKSRL